MLPRPLLAVLPWLLAAFAEAASQTVAEPVAAGADSVRPMSGRLLGGDGYDGHVFLALGRQPGWEDGLAGRASVLFGWNPTFAGFSSRLAVAAMYQGIQPSSSQGFHTRLTRSVFGLDEAWLGYPFGAFSWKAGLQAGWFRWRSHADAALAGEYLARWNAYPATQVHREYGFEALDSLTTVLTGLRFSLDSPARRFRQEAIVRLDTLDPGLALSFLWSLNIAPLPGIEAGFAVELDRLYEAEESQGPAVLRIRHYVYQDTVAGTGQVITVDSVDVTRYEIESRSLAARLTLDPMTLFTGKSRPDRGGRFYLEAALLGWENAPVFYDDRIQRLHFNAGLNLPAFGFLDVLRFQAELWPEPQGNSLQEIYQRTLPVPDSLNPTGGDMAGFSTSSRAAKSHGWRGQLYLSRALLPWLDVQGRVISERSRRLSRVNFSLRPEPVPVEPRTWNSFEVRIVARL